MHYFLFSFSVWDSSDCRKQGETHIDDDIFEICTGSVSFLFKIQAWEHCKNLCAYTTVAIIHTDPTVNHRLICTPGHYTSRHTKCMQLCSSQVNFYRKGGPRANAGLPSLLIRVVPHHLWCKWVLCCFAGALAASATDIQQTRVNNHCSQQVCITQPASATCHGPWVQLANTNCGIVRPP